ncbi:hypothetical protein glysoja_008212 [Glycine soja]|nr:hypothetical protein glysoja_008212 [Glycine soja]
MTSYFVDTCVSKEVDMFISHSMSQNISQRYVLVQILAQNNNGHGGSPTLFTWIEVSNVTF